MFVRYDGETPPLYAVGGSKLPEWTITQDELEDLRDAIDLVLPRVTSVTYQQGGTDPTGVAWRKAHRTDPEHTS